MRYRRRIHRNPTPHQLTLHRYADRARLRLMVISSGMAEAFKRGIDSYEELDAIQAIIDYDLRPAIKLAERTQADVDASYSKPRKTAPGRTSKTRVAEPRPMRPKKKGTP